MPQTQTMEQVVDDAEQAGTQPPAQTPGVTTQAVGSPPAPSASPVQTGAISPTGPVSAPTLRPEETVQSQLGGLLEGGSDYIRQAERQGEQFAAKRGLLNSSLAAGAARTSAIQAALPIAQQDAGQEFQRGQTKLQGDIQQAAIISEYQQRGLLSAQEAQQQRDTIAAEYGLRSGLSEQEFNQGMKQSEANFGFQMELAQFNQESALELNRMQYQYQTLFQTSQTAAAAYSDLMNQVSAIMRDEKLTPEAKNTAIRNLTAYTQSSLNLTAALAEAGGVTISGATAPGGGGPAAPGTAPVVPGAEPTPTPASRPQGFAATVRAAIEAGKQRRPAPAPAPTPAPPQTGRPAVGIQQPENGEAGPRYNPQYQ